MITENEHADLVERAEELGAEHGKSAGTYVGVDSGNAADLIRWDDEGDFDRFDEASGYRAPLAGEFADDWTPGRLLDVLDATDLNEGEEHDVVTAYENMHRQAFVDEVLRQADYHAEGDEDSERDGARWIAVARRYG